MCHWYVSSELSLEGGSLLLTSLSYMQIFLPDCYMGGHDRFLIVSRRRPFVRELWLAKIVSQRTKGKHLN